MDMNEFVSLLVGGGAPAAGNVTPKLTSRSQNLPGQQRDKVKKDLKANPQGDTPATVGTPANPDANVQQLLDMILNTGASDGVHPLDASGSMGSNAILGMLGEEFGEGDFQGQSADQLAYMLGMGGTGEMVPQMKQTGAGAPHPKNFDPMSQLLNMILGQVGKDAPPDGPEGDIYGDDE